MKTTLSFLTPLWTADASKTTRRAVGTGLIGGLRWWYETLVRGLGGWACDPSDANTRCPPGGTAATPQDLCPACQLFGATGWARTFTLALDDHTQTRYPPTGRDRVKTDGGRLNRDDKPSAWYFPPGRSDGLTLTLLPRRPDDSETIPLLLGLLEFIRRNAALGAKTGLGYGLFAWESVPAELPAAQEWVQNLAARAAAGRRGPSGCWPNLQEMFFAEVKLKQAWRPEDFVNFKYDLRAAFRTGNIPSSLRHFLLGKVSRNANQATKIKMALLPDRRTLRLWGWVPNSLPGGFPRENAMEILYKQVGRLGRLSRWREFRSARDTVKTCNDAGDYLRSLMEG